MSWGFTCPARGGAEWHELTTPHFVVSSDLDIRQSRKLAGEVERLYGAVSRGLFRSPPEILGTDAPEEASKLREELARVEEACTPRPVTPPLQGSAPSPP